MKKLSLTALIFAFLLFISNGMQAQTTQTELNQLELLKQFLGTWKGVISGDTTTLAWECKSFSYGTEISSKIEVKGNILFEMKSLIGYDRENDKLIEADLIYSNIVLSALWFTSKNTCTQIPYELLSHPERVSKKTNYEFKSPDLFIQTEFTNNYPVRTYTYTRQK